MVGQAKLKGSYAYRCASAVRIKSATNHDAAFIKHGYEIGINEGAIADVPQLDSYLERALAGKYISMKSKKVNGEGLTTSSVLSRFLVAYKDDVPVGFAQISCVCGEDNDVRNEVLYVFVDVSLRGKGVAQKLIKEAIESSPREIVLVARIIKASSFSCASEKLLSKLGFCVVDETERTKFLVYLK